MDIAHLGNNAVTHCPCCDHLMWIDGRIVECEITELQQMLRQHVNDNPKCREYMDGLPTMSDLQETLGPIMMESERERALRQEHNPNNGRPGYWLVSGVRHEARTFATSAPEAVQKCSEVVGDWESPEASFIGETLPDVF